MSDNPPLLPTASSTFTCINEETGLIEVLDSKTGNVLAVQTSTMDLYEQKEDNLVKYEVEGREIWVERTIDLDKLPSFADKIFYSKTLVDLICQRILNGETIKAICEDPAFPSYYVLSKWKRQHDYCREAIEQAKEDRAEWLVAEAQEIVDTADETTIKKATVQADMRKWQASKEAPTKYGNKVELTGKQPVQFILETGIRRQDDDNFKVDETAKIKDVNVSDS